MRRLLAILILLLPLAAIHAQDEVVNAMRHPISGGGANTWTNVQTVHGSCSSCTSLSLTVASTGSNHLLEVDVVATNGPTAAISSISGGGTWTIDSGCTASDGTAYGVVTCAYVACASTSGSTSVTLTLSGSNNYNAVFREVTASTGSCAKDSSGTLGTASNTTIDGPALTLTGTKDAEFNSCDFGGGTTVSVATPYTLDWNNTATGTAGFASQLNATTGTGAVFTLGTAQASHCGGIAFK